MSNDRKRVFDYILNEEVGINPERMDEFLRKWRLAFQHGRAGTVSGKPTSGGFRFDFDSYDFYDESKWKESKDDAEYVKTYWERQADQERLRKEKAERFTYEGKPRPKVEPRRDGGLRRSKQQDDERAKAIPLFGKIIRMVQSDFAGQASAALYQAAKLYTRYRDSLTHADRLDFLQQLNEAVLSYTRRFGEVPADLMPAFQELRP